MKTKFSNLAAALSLLALAFTFTGCAGTGPIADRLPFMNAARQAPPTTMTSSNVDSGAAFDHYASDAYEPEPAGRMARVNRASGLFGSGGACTSG